MTILAIGGTGQVGSLVVEELARRGAQVRALGTKPRPESHQTYATPVGKVGLTMIDGRDVATIELLRRERSGEPLPMETIELVGPEAFTGESIVRLWSDVLGKQVTCAGDDLEAVQKAFRTSMPSADAYSLAMIFRGIV